MVIYDKKDWKVKNEYVEDWNSSRIKTYCINRKQSLEFTGKLIKLPCNNQDEIIKSFNIASKILITKNKIKSKVLVRYK